MIRERRVRQIMEDVAKASLLKGYVPTPDEVTSRFNRVAQGSDPGLPRMQLREQGFKAKFRLDWFNMTYQELVEDLALLYEENVGSILAILKGLNTDEIRSRSLAYQTAIVSDMLEDLLLIEPAAAGYFFGVYDSFNDLSKVDMASTSAEVDLDAGLVRLPIAGGVNRHDLASVMSGRGRAALKFDEGRQVTITPIAGCSFENAFDDVDGTAWQEEVESPTPDPMTVTFIIPLSGTQASGSAELAEHHPVPISRIEVLPLVASVTALKVYYSIDAVNYLLLPDHPPIVQMTDKKVSIIIPEVLARYLKIQLAKSFDEEAEVGGRKVYKFVFGMRGFAAYHSGFASSAVLTSKELTPQNSDDQTVCKVALNVDELVPQGTNIDYFVAKADSPSDWQQVSSNIREQDAPRVVEFQSSVLSPRQDNRVRIQTTPVLNSNRNGINFYTILSAANQPIPQSGRLFRGLNAWSRRRVVQESVKTVLNNYVVFTLNDNDQKLYLDVDNELVTPATSWDQVNQTPVALANQILRDESVPVIPATAGTAASGTPQEDPKYSVRLVLRLPATAPSGNDADVVVSGAYAPRNVEVTLPAAAIGKVTPGSFIRLTPSGGVPGYYYVEEVQESAIEVLCRITDPNDTMTTAINIDWEVGYQNITVHVDDVQNNNLLFNPSCQILVSDKLLVSYRRPLGPEHRLITSSVVVKSNQDGGSTYELGRDYSVDPIRKSVTRNIQGTISGVGDQVVVRVDFQYAYTEARLDTYTTYMMVESADPKKIVLASGLSVDSAIGESVTLDNGVGFFNIVDQTDLPELPKGWRQIAVVSKPIIDPTTGNVDQTSALYRVMTAKDAEGFLAFAPIGKYFTRMTAYPDALREISLFRLQTGIAKDDHEWFAFDGQDAIINWDPTDMPDSVYPVIDNTGPSPIVSLLDYEEFELSYRYKGPEAPVQSVLFKAVLTRQPDAAKSLTPQLLSYNLRFSY